MTFIFEGKNKNLGPRDLSLQVMQNIFSPNRFFKTSPHDNSQILEKFQQIKKLYLYL